VGDVTSADGTVIAYDRSGSGPALVLVSPAFGDRAGMAPLAAALAPQLTVLAYDRRGRGDSGDTAPYAVEREIDDLASRRPAGRRANRRGEAVEYFWRVALTMPEQAISGCKVVADVAPPGVDGPHALV
jgi:pimeloyl-ACP methyl ester carboxylesterase